MKTIPFLPGSALLLALLCLLGSLPAAAETGPARIVVSGEGDADLAPDMAVLTLTVMREASTARKALDANSAAMADVLAAMKAAGIADRDLQTAGFSVQPRYSQPPRQPDGARPAREIVGYQVRNTLTVRVRDIASVGEILDTSVKLGVNEGGDIRFTNADPGDALTEARKRAVAAAMAKATTLAESAGVALGPILEISEHSRRIGPMPMARAEMAMAMSDAVPVAAGENRYTVTVNMTFEIKQ